MKSFDEILKSLESIKTDEKLLQEYKESFEEIVTNTEPDVIYDAMQDFPDNLIVLTPLYVGSLFKYHRFPRNL